MPSIAPAGIITSANLPGRSRGTATPAATALQTVFQIPHGLGAAPAFWQVTPASVLGAGVFFTTADATNITVTYLTPPGAGSLNLRWAAEL